MRDLNIDFMDLYKRTDRFIKDAYSSSDGVSEYIRLMEASFNRGNANIQGWKSDYDNLKHIRWIRNQLAHEVSYDSDICSESDYEWLEDFYKRLFSSTDPLGELRTFENIVSYNSNRSKPLAANRPQQSPRVVYPPPQPMQQRPNVNQSAGCLGTFMMMLILSVSIIISLFMFL
ncbi:MAG: hypothetical protein K6G33_14200 [Ruminococcus sp.]|uniref:DUF6548 family protein n=1 Tax=Ruminococcus sp. TaxID=41978 RepID=UPI0025F8D25B|nr:DUF6548 family protein [Ruminococcus sp.]MCR5601873.1 hypothetical protein [Ruminococcus sp.]